MEFFGYIFHGNNRYAQKNVPLKIYPVFLPIAHSLYFHSQLLHRAHEYLLFSMYGQFLLTNNWLT